MSAARLTGAGVLRVEDPRLLTGTATFTADMAAPGQLHAVFVRSPHAHARVNAFDLTAARAARGVHAVFAHGDLAAVLPALRPAPFPGLLAPEHTALADDTVRFVGDPVVLVVADTPAHAEDIARAIPGAELAPCEGGTHLLPLERHDELARLVTGFLERRVLGVGQSPHAG